MVLWMLRAYCYLWQQVCNIHWDNVGHLRMLHTTVNHTAVHLFLNKDSLPILSILSGRLILTWRNGYIKLTCVNNCRVIHFIQMKTLKLPVASTTLLAIQFAFYFHSPICLHCMVLRRRGQFYFTSYISANLSTAQILLLGCHEFMFCRGFTSLMHSLLLLSQHNSNFPVL